jgi:hypothetical protein
VCTVDSTGLEWGCGEWMGFTERVPRFAQERIKMKVQRETWRCCCRLLGVGAWRENNIGKLVQGKRGTSWRDNGWMIGSGGC